MFNAMMAQTEANYPEYAKRIFIIKGKITFHLYTSERPSARSEQFLGTRFLGPEFLDQGILSPKARCPILSNIFEQCTPRNPVHFRNSKKDKTKECILNESARKETIELSGNHCIHHAFLCFSPEIVSVHLLAGKALPV